MRNAKQPELPVILLEDLGALLGLVPGLFGVSLTLLTHDGTWDALGTAMIGLLLVAAKIRIGVADSGLDISKAIDSAEARIRQAVPIARVIYLEPDLERVDA